MPEAEPHILFEKRGALGLVTLNRPRALNALTHGMCMGLAKKLAEWAQDSEIATVAVRGAGPRAFCAGADIRALFESGRDHTNYAARFLADEYRLNVAIADFPKPYIALLHGIVMGGGAGISVHGRFRAADAALAFAMPETAIGFIPDIGATYFLSRLPGEVGLYLALTGQRIGRDDAMALGLVTHGVPLEDHDALIGMLADGKPAVPVLETFAVKPVPSPLLAQRRQLDTIFAAPSLEAIFERLERDGSDFSIVTINTLRSRSPSALKLTFRALRAGRSLDLRDCLKMEYRIATRAIPAHDFQEGVRSLIIDKDGRPHWQPASFASLPDADISAYFEALGARELSFA